ncbi:MAG: hypothetical protein ACYTXY_03745 [Nostoc sp.]
MRRFIRTAKAKEDWIEIWIYITADNPTALLLKFRSLAVHYGN